MRIPFGETARRVRNEDAARPSWRQHFGATNRVFNGVAMALKATEMHEDEAPDSRKPVAPAILSPVFVQSASSTEWLGI
jgi:hypothetical protein